MQKLGQGDKLVLKNINFQTNSDKFETSSFPELMTLVEMMKLNSAIKVQISGHTDNVGSEEKNLKLSESRAKAVVNFFIKNGVNENRLTYKGYGSETPIANNNDEAGRLLNRRVEILILSY